MRDERTMLEMIGPAGDTRVRGIAASIITVYDGLVRSDGTITAEQAVDAIKPASVSLRFFCVAIDALERQHGDRSVGYKMERVRFFLARAEEAFKELERVSPSPGSPPALLNSSAPSLKCNGRGGELDLSSGLRSETNRPQLGTIALPIQPIAEERVTMATKKKTVKKAASKPRSPKKKPAKKPAAKKRAL